MDAMVSSCLGVITAAAQNQGQAFAQSLNVFMSPEHKEAFDNMQAIAPVAGKETDEMFLKYSWEGQRLDPQVSDCLFRDACWTGADCVEKGPWYSSCR